jgi:hypothetical protein
MFDLHRFASEQGRAEEPARFKWHSLWTIDVPKSIARE